MEGFRFSLITPRPMVNLPTSQDASKRKRTREEFEAAQMKPIHSYHNPISQESILKVPVLEKKSNPPEELYQYKHEKIIESQTQSLLETQRFKSENNLKYKSVSQVVEQYMELDEKYTDLKHIKDVSASTDEYDLSVNEFLYAKHIPYPRRIFDYYATVPERNSVIRGISHEANLIYVAVNNKLFLWRYSEITQFDEKYDPAIELEQHPVVSDENFIEKDMMTDITAIVIGRPKPYIFVSQKVDFIMVIATYESIQIFSIESGPEGLSLKPTDFVLGTDGILVRSLLCTKSGRIFAGQSNSKVTELSYEETKKLFGLLKNTDLKRLSDKKQRIEDYLPDFQQLFYTNNYTIVQLSYDETRHILYALAHDTNPGRFKILVYDLGITGQNFEFVLEITHNSLKNRLVEHSMKIEKTELADLQVTSICAIDRRQADEICLLAVTNLGIRVYLKIATEKIPDKEIAKHETVENIGQLFNYWRLLPRYEIVLIKLPIVQSASQILMNQNSLLPSNKTKLTSGLVSNRYQLKQSELSKENGLVVADGSDPTVEPDGIYAFMLNSAFQSLNAKKYSSSPYMKRPTPESISIISLSHEYETIESFQSKESRLFVPISLSNLLGHNLPKYFSFDRLMGIKTGNLALESLGDVAKQTYYNPSLLTVFTNQAIDFIVRIRPIDVLFQMLDIQVRLDSDIGFRSFVEKYGAADTCAMLVQLYCNKEQWYYVNTAADEEFRNQFARSDTGMMGMGMNRKSLLDFQVKCLQPYPELIEQAAMNFFQLGDLILKFETGYHIHNELYDTLGRVIEPEKRKYTSKVEGLIAYFGRLIRPIWNCHVFNRWAFIGHDVNASVEVFKKDELKLLRKKLIDLKSFMLHHNLLLLTMRDEFEEYNLKNSDRIPFYERGADPSQYPDYVNLQRMSEGRKNVPYSDMSNRKMGIIDDTLVLEDQRTLDNLYLLIERVIQTLDVLILIISDRNKMIECLYNIDFSECETILNARFSDVFREVESQYVLKSMLFIHLKRCHSSNFFDLGRSFISNFPQFFTEHDLTICEAERKLEQAILNLPERQALVNEGLTKLNQCIAHLANKKIVQLFPLFRELGLFPEYARLLIQRTKALTNLASGVQKEKSNLAENSHPPLMAKETISAIELENNHDLTFTREQIIKLLEELQASISTKPVPKNPRVFDFISQEERLKLRNKLVLEILNFKDKFTHISLIKWFLKHALYSELIDEIKSDFIEDAVLSETLPELMKLGILHKYYIKNKIYDKGYEIAIKLANYKESESLGVASLIALKPPEITLSERINYLRDAKYCLENLELQRRGDAQQRDILLRMLKELRDTFKLAELQQRIDQRYAQIMATGPRRTESELRELQNKRFELQRMLLPREILYEEYIARDKLHECAVYFLLESDKVDKEHLYAAYTEFITQTYEEKPNEWPHTIKEKLLSLYTEIKEKEKEKSFYDVQFMFPLYHILKVLEDTNRDCARFKVELENISRSFVGRGGGNVSLSKLSIPFWAVYFFVDDLSFSFDTLFEVYKALYLYPNGRITKENFSEKYLLGNSILTLIEYWLEQIRTHLKYLIVSESTEKNQFSYATIQDLLGRKFEIIDMISDLKRDYEQLSDMKLVKSDLIKLSLGFIEKVSLLLDAMVQEIGQKTDLRDVSGDSSFYTAKREFSEKTASFRSFRSFN